MHHTSNPWYHAPPTNYTAQHSTTTCLPPTHHCALPAFCCSARLRHWQRHRRRNQWHSLYFAFGQMNLEPCIQMPPQSCITKMHQNTIKMHQNTIKMHQNTFKMHQNTSKIPSKCTKIPPKSLQIPPNSHQNAQEICLGAHPPAPRRW